jgi:hypothetical protein
MPHTPSIKEGAVPPTWDLGDFILRPLAHGNEVAWAAYLSDSRVTDHTTFGKVDIETVTNAVRRHIGEYSAATACRWALANSNGELIGTCGLLNWSLRPVGARPVGASQFLRPLRNPEAHGCRNARQTLSTKAASEQLTRI